MLFTIRGELLCQLLEDQFDGFVSVLILSIGVKITQHFCDNFAVRGDSGYGN